MDPLTLSLALGGVGTGLNLFGQRKARKEAKKAQAEQRKEDALYNLMAVAGGQGISKPSPISSLPQVDVGSALIQLGQLANSYDMQKQNKKLINAKADYYKGGGRRGGQQNVLNWRQFYSDQD